MKGGGESYGASKSRLWNKNVEMKSGRFPKTDACKQTGRCFTDDLTKGDKAAVESKIIRREQYFQGLYGFIENVQIFA